MIKVLIALVLIATLLVSGCTTDLSTTGSVTEDEALDVFEQELDEVDTSEGMESDFLNLLEQ